jgi:hypothetical protein
LSMNGGAVPQPPLLGSDFDFPPGGIPSLHLPLVVVIYLHFEIVPPLSLSQLVYLCYQHFHL